MVEDDGDGYGRRSSPPFSIWRENRTWTLWIFGSMMYCTVLYWLLRVAKDILLELQYFLAGGGASQSLSRSHFSNSYAWWLFPLDYITWFLARKRCPSTVIGIMTKSICTQLVRVAKNGRRTVLYDLINLCSPKLVLTKYVCNFQLEEDFQHFLISIQTVGKEPKMWQGSISYKNMVKYFLKDTIR